jgi:mannosyltransferase
MVPLVVRRRPLARALPVPSEGVATAALLAALVLLSLLLRTSAMHDAFWIDEGLSVGISSFPFGHIPEVLRQDGSPPLYYMLLHLWMQVDGDGEGATRVPSLVFALATIPAGFWAGRSLFGPRAGWICAGLCALNPFVSAYAQETRMYSMMMLFGLVGAAGFMHAFVFRRRRYLAVFAGALALMLYTHNWSLFFALGSVAALLVVARESDAPRAILRDGALAFGGTLLLFAPWIPTLVFQTQHTGAPWSNPPALSALTGGLASVLGGSGAAMALVMAAGAGMAQGIGLPRGRHRTLLLATLALALVTFLSAWTSSQLSPAWALRYLAAGTGPLLLLAAAGLSRARRMGLAALALVALLWVTQGVKTEGPTAERPVLAKVQTPLHAGDLVISTHPERLAVISYYLPKGVRYASPLGPAGDPRVMDWRDALARLERSTVRKTLEPLLDTLPPGRALLLVRPVTRDIPSWNAPWTSLVRRRSSLWARALAQDPRFARLATAPDRLGAADNGVRATLYMKVRN